MASFKHISELLYKCHKEHDFANKIQKQKIAFLTKQIDDLRLTNECLIHENKCLMYENKNLWRLHRNTGKRVRNGQVEITKKIDYMDLSKDDDQTTEESNEEKINKKFPNKKVKIENVKDDDTVNLFNKPKEFVEAETKQAEVEETVEEEVEETVEEEVEEEVEETVEEEVEETAEEEVEETVEEEAEEEAEEEEEVYTVTIDGKEYFTTNEKTGMIYEVTSDGDVGEEVGYYEDGEPGFYE